MFNLHASIFTTHYTISGPRKLPFFVLKNKKLILFSPKLFNQKYLSNLSYYFNLAVIV